MHGNAAEGVCATALGQRGGIGCGEPLSQRQRPKAHVRYVRWRSHQLIPESSQESVMESPVRSCLLYSQMTMSLEQLSKWWQPAAQGKKMEARNNQPLLLPTWAMKMTLIRRGVGFSMWRLRRNQVPLDPLNPTVISVSVHTHIKPRERAYPKGYSYLFHSSTSLTFMSVWKIIPKLGRYLAMTRKLIWLSF